MGRTPLARATKIRDTIMVKLLLSYRNQNGKTVTGSEQGETPPHTIALRRSEDLGMIVGAEGARLKSAKGPLEKKKVFHPLFL